MSEVMKNMDPTQALYIYLYIRKKSFRAYYVAAFNSLQNVLVQYHDVRSMLIMGYEMMLRDSENHPRWWTQFIQSLLYIKENITEHHELELKKILVHALNHRECNNSLRNDILRLSEKTFQYIPEVWGEVLREPSYTMPEDLLQALLKILLENKKSMWTPTALEVLIPPTSEAFWQSLSHEMIDVLMDMCPNAAVRELLEAKCAQGQASRLMPPPLPPSALLSMEEEVSCQITCFRNAIIP